MHQKRLTVREGSSASLRSGPWRLSIRKSFSSSQLCVTNALIGIKLQRLASGTSTLMARETRRFQCSEHRQRSYALTLFHSLQKALRSLSK